MTACTHHLRLADYLLEVKATTTGEVRLMASDNPDRFVLCVVDLRGITSERMRAKWTVSDVEPRARIVVDIGPMAGESHGLVKQAGDCQVGVRNDAALRYGVPVTVWQKACPW